MIVNVSQRLGDLNKYKYNPALMQRAALDVLTKVTEGQVDIVDATNPFVFTLETSAVNTAAMIQNTEVLNRKQYATAAVTSEDLYLHMSDKDYVGRFALPSSAVFTMTIAKEELEQALVFNPATGISKVTIPRNTKFTIANTIFSLQYPIDIRKLQHGGLSIVYNTSSISPLYELETNLIEFDEVRDPDGNDYITFTFLTHQFDIITKYNDINSAVGFETNIGITDQFYHVRVYLQGANRRWNEIKTTHTDQIYDVTDPTAVITVLENNISVTIPSVYTTTGLVRGKLRIDVYQTKGNISLDLSSYKLTDYSAVWLSIDNNDSTAETAAINDIKTLFTYSLDTTKGGRSALTTDELKVRVINNSIGPQSLPITNIQLEDSIKDAGYEFVKNVDTLTNRVYLATREMPKPTDSDLVTAAASNVSRVTLTLNEAIDSHGVLVTPRRIILSSNTLYKTDNGITRLVSKMNKQQIDAMPLSNKCNYLNNANYSYSPFHYVLDVTNSTFGVRPYYLDEPVILNKSFISENPLTGLQVNMSSNYLVEKNDNGYKITIRTKSNDNYKALDDSNVFCQLAYKGSDQALYSYLLAEQITRAADTDERIFIFNLDSNFDIDEKHMLSQNAFRFSPTDLSTYCDLLQNMHVLFLTNNPSVNNSSPIEADQLIGQFQVPSGCIAITHERFKIRFGYFLSRLWSRAKSLSTSLNYMKYSVDELATYVEDIYDVDNITGSAFSLDAGGQLVYRILHAKGSAILDSNGNQLIKHRAGDVILDNNGQPIIEDSSNNQVTRFVDISVIEAGYMFATDPSSQSYKKVITKAMIDWITNDLPRFNTRLLDQTKIYFYPKSTQGDITCTGDDGSVSTISATQSFKLTLTVPLETYNNTLLTNEINRITVATINEELLNPTITVSGIEYVLKNKYGKDVLDVKLEGFDNGKHNVISIVDKSTKLSIKKKLVLLPSNLIILQEDVVINYVKHK
jgi:hypothetical protein